MEININLKSIGYMLIVLGIVTSYPLHFYHMHKSCGMYRKIEPIVLEIQGNVIFKAEINKDEIVKNRTYSFILSPITYPFSLIFDLVKQTTIYSEKVEEEPIQLIPKKDKIASNHHGIFKTI